MDAIVLAGGYATRLWPLTRDRPKMLLPIGEDTIIDGILSDLEADDRISNVYISTNEFFEDELRDFVEESPYEKPQMSIEQSHDEDEKFGVVGALAQLVDRENVDDDTLVIAGDNLMGFDLADFVTYFKSEDKPCLAAYDVGSKERAKSYGVIDVEDDVVTGFEEKPDDPESTLCSIACYAFPAETVALFDEYLAGDNNPDEPGWFIQWLIENETVAAYGFDSYWFDVGDAKGYLDAIEWAFDDETIVSPDATVSNSTLGPNVQVMEGAEVSDATLEHTLVFPGATVTNASLRESIVDSEASVSNVALKGALVGSDSDIHD